MMKRFSIFLLIFTFLILSVFSCSKEKKPSVQSLSLVEEEAPIKPSIESVVVVESDQTRRTASQKELAPIAMVADSKADVFQIDIQASEGGQASFKEEQVPSGTPYVAVAVADEGYFFDHWDISAGKTSDEITASTISIFEEDEGVVLKAIFKRDLSTLFVDPNASRTKQAMGTRTAPYFKLTDAVAEAVSRIEGNATSAIQLRLAKGLYRLQRQEMLELLPGISIIGGFNPSNWSNEGVALSDDYENHSVIQLAPSFVAESMLSVTPSRGSASIVCQSKQSALCNEVVLSSLVLDGFSTPAVLLSSHGVPIKISSCRLEGYGKALISGFDCGVSLTDSDLYSYGSRSTAISVEPVSEPGVYIANNKMVLGKDSKALLQGVGVQIYSPEKIAYSSVQLLNNEISAYVTETFTGIKVDNGSMICSNNRIESFNEEAGSSFGMELKGAAVVNKNWISIGSNDGWGLSLESNGASGRILNNTILTRSVSQNGKLTACGPIEGKDLMISYNVFVNPAQSEAAALGVEILTEGHTVSNNRLISNNVAEKQFLIGLNGNIDILPDELRSISETAQEVQLQY